MPEIWDAVCANDKKAVYRYIVTSETDINTVFQQASSSSSLTLAKVMLLQEQTSQNQSCGSERSSTSSLNLGSAGDSQRMDYLEGCTLLHLACEAADIGMLELLLQYGANVNAVDSGGNMPLHRCILRGRAANAKMLLARCTKRSCWLVMTDYYLQPFIMPWSFDKLNCYI